MNFSKPAALLLLGALACTAVQASETYTYDSSPILGFGGGPGVEFTFAFTVPVALADGSYNFADPSELPAGFSYVATDGYLTLTDNAGLFGVSGPQLTIAGGQVTSYAFYVQDLSSPPSAIYGYPTFYAAKLTGQPADNVQLTDPSNPNIVGFDYTDGSGVDQHVPTADRGDADASGFWTVGTIAGSVPENGSLALMSLGSALLLALSRRAGRAR
ncbi:hypothetical protein [Scleromatobacter humisilvae]|uniref:PEP-CTERM protein-sorting domain-containing protein n=1 Tax=Scleromatobacter humisilvae TaxID=2897159 RepID=A0A9X2BXT1_9BURK|nr:hypothetical protein [Scleromatobacter humisilvae]MCK9684692.1 hypothetical protein [Scleromatobacter humisilvae]